MGEQHCLHLELDELHNMTNEVKHQPQTLTMKPSRRSFHGTTLPNLPSALIIL